MAYPMGFPPQGITVPAVADTRTSTIVVAAANSLNPNLAPAAYRCTGVNDEVEMNAALVAAAAVNGRVELLEGDYNTVLTLSVAINVALVGNGWGTVIYFNAGGNAVTVAGNNVKLRDFKVVIVAGAGAGGSRPNPIYAGNVEMVEIFGCWLVGDETVADDGTSIRQTGIFFENVSFSKITNCTSEDNVRQGIYLLGSPKNIILGNSCHSNTNNGIYLYTDSVQNAIVGNNCLDNTAMGLAIYVPNNTIVGNNCTGNAGNGMAFSFGGADCTVVGNTCQNNTFDGITLGTSDTNTLTGNTCQGNGRYGIYLETSTENTITGNTCQLNDISGIYLTDVSNNNTVTGNNCQGHLSIGIALYVDSDNNTVTGNTCQGNSRGIYLSDSKFNTVTGNTCQGNDNQGIYLISCTGGNTIAGNTSQGNTWAGISVYQSSNNTVTGNNCTLNTREGIKINESSGNTVTGNTCYQNTWHGIKIEFSSNNTIVGNNCRENDYANTATYDGICIEDDSDYNIVHSNICNDNDRWGISIGVAANDCVGNWVKNNILTGNTSGAFIDNGTDTKLATIQADFVHVVGGAWVDPVVDTSPGGIDLDADGEIAMCHIKLPLELQLVMRIQIWAYSQLIEAANNMLLQINIHGATSSELWNTNAIDVIQHPSEETGAIVVGDVIHWIIDATDDADVAALTACDKLEILAVGEAAVAPDVATDALFGVALIEYV